MVVNYISKPDHLSPIIKYCCQQRYPKTISSSFVIRINVVFNLIIDEYQLSSAHNILSTTKLETTNNKQQTIIDLNGYC